jgi:hypothetical protein
MDRIRNESYVPPVLLVLLVPLVLLALVVLLLLLVILVPLLPVLVGLPVLLTLLVLLVPVDLLHVTTWIQGIRCPVDISRNDCLRFSVKSRPCTKQPVLIVY